jgi:ParB-like chromosome segregation protein Spo0J
MKKPPPGQEKAAFSQVTTVQRDNTLTAYPVQVRTLAIDEIIIGVRHRVDMGDLAELAASISDVGLLNPIVVTRAGVLVAGARRLATCKQLGWSEIPATILDDV